MTIKLAKFVVPNSRQPPDIGQNPVILPPPPPQNEPLKSPPRLGLNNLEVYVLIVLLKWR